MLAGELDLNATPRGFDLNAPVVEEEDSAELSVWQSEPFVSRGPPIALPSQPVPGDPTRPGDAALVCAVQVTESVDLTDEAEKNSACTVNDTAKGDVIEDASKAGSACPLKLAACIAIPVEIVSTCCCRLFVKYGLCCKTGQIIVVSGVICETLTLFCPQSSSLGVDEGQCCTHFCT